jgi:hypothetical protein
MTEEFLSFIWQYKLYKPDTLHLGGEKVTVIYPGELNRNAGPDFFNTKLKIGDTIWAGNVEVHIKASDWNTHEHDTNPAFDNVILHITHQNDQPVYTSGGRQVATLALEFDEVYFRNHNALLGTQKWIPCADDLGSVDAIFLSSFMSKLGIERLEGRTRQITDNLDQTVNDWDEAFYRQIARSFGFHVNSQPFESLARSIPYIIVKKYSHDLTQLEALFFGQAGFLHDDYNSDDYYNKLKTEYRFLRAKYKLQPLDTYLWKFMRLRPNNFPAVRIAQFSALIHRNPSLFSGILEAESLDHLLEKLSVDVSEYWHNHYLFDRPSVSAIKLMGKESAMIIIMNTIVPFYFTYGKKMGLPQLQDKALQFLEEIEAEDNSTIKQWRQSGIIPRNAFDSQALLQLKNEYCDKKHCLACAIGAKIISRI